MWSKLGISPAYQVENSRVFDGSVISWVRNLTAVASPYDCFFPFFPLSLGTFSLSHEPALSWMSPSPPSPWMLQGANSVGGSAGKNWHWSSWFVASTDVLVGRGFCRSPLSNPLLQVGCAFALETSKDRDNSHNTSPHRAALLVEEKRGLYKAYCTENTAIHRRAQSSTVSYCNGTPWGKITAGFVFLDQELINSHRGSPQAARQHSKPLSVPACRAGSSLSKGSSEPHSNMQSMHSRRRGLESVCMNTPLKRKQAP